MAYDGSDKDRETAAVLIQARAVMKERGWTNGAPLRFGPVCILAAISVAVLEDAERWYENEVILPYAKAMGFISLSGAFTWNDSRRTPEEVFARFDAAIERLTGMDIGKVIEEGDRKIEVPDWTKGVPARPAVEPSAPVPTRPEREKVKEPA